MPMPARHRRNPQKLTQSGRSSPSPGRAASLLSVFGVAAVLLAGCAQLGIESKKIDYRSSSRAPSLEIPPDLSSPVYDERYKAITASGQQAGAEAPGQASRLLPVTANARIDRAGNERWLVVSTTPEAAWIVARDFWTQNGFNIVTERPEAGVMVTDWAENRAKLPQDIITRTLSNVLGLLYSTNTLDRFRTRIERGTEAGTVEIYISHQGMEEVPRGQSDGTATNFIWTTRPVDPDLEAEFLRRMMVKFGAPASDAAQAVAQSGTPAEQRARIAKSGEGVPQLVVDDAFDRAWRRVGLALDRSGFTVVDRDRTRGLYFVRFSDPETTIKRDEGWLSKLMFWRTDDTRERPEQYRVVVSELPSSTLVMVQDPSGNPDRSATADRILGLLQQQLK